MEGVHVRMNEMELVINDHESSPVWYKFRNMVGLFGLFFEDLDVPGRKLGSMVIINGLQLASKWGRLESSPTDPNFLLEYIQSRVALPRNLLNRLKVPHGTGISTYVHH